MSRALIAVVLTLLVTRLLRADAPSVVAIYPSAHQLPANHLKFYLHFREPMRKGVFLDHCQLLDAHDKPVLEPFRETELWSEDGLRLTLWLHPGRQKTGVNLNDEFGPVLLPHQRYTLLISGKWPTENGPVLGQDAKKDFVTVDRATLQLDVADWKITPPAAGTLHPAELRFPAPLDHALLQRCLHVLKAKGREVVGAVSTAAAERVWRFTPATPWEAGDYEVVADSILEDLAGNSLARPFEVDLTGPAPRKTTSTVALKFGVQ